jgi:hypothetical protein
VKYDARHTEWAQKDPAAAEATCPCRCGGVVSVYTTAAGTTVALRFCRHGLFLPGVCSTCSWNENRRLRRKSH